MKHTFNIISLLICFISFSQSFVGSWSGNLKLPSVSLQVVFNIKNENNAWLATMDSPNQGAFGIPVQSVLVKGDSIYLKDTRILMEYRGVLINNEIKGQFKQSNFSFDLDLSHSNQVKKPNRPQTPQPPFTYKVEDVTIENKTDNVSLSGTLTLPNNIKKPSLVILISGSGPQDRDETIFEHKPFAVIADFLTKNGFAVFRYDDRGTAKSTGNFMEATSFNFASDVDAIVNALALRNDIDRKKIGVLGHSEGGLVAAIAAANNPKIKFIISMAGPGVNGQEVLLDQTYLIGVGSGISPQQIEQNININKALYQTILDEDWLNFNESATRVALKYKTLDPKVSKVSDDELIKTIIPKNIHWFKTFLQTNPATYYKKLKIPIFAINGENDVQVNYEQNLPALQAVFNNKNSQTKSYPNLNHLFQTSKTQTIAEYNDLEETISPIILQDILDWLKFNKL